jgi:8-hydroxy-5-deazaflavin:NADPH oxidoreductase
MKVTIIGRGNIGGGLAQRLAARHDVTTLGRDGGDASDADVVVLAVPGDSIAEALARVRGVEGKVVVDTTNPMRGRPDGFESLADQVKSLTGGPVAKAFNTNFARLYDRLDDAAVRPSNFWCGDEEARAATEELSRDAGYEPVCAGGLEQARMLEDVVAGLQMPVARAGRGPFFYRIFWPDES